MQGNMNHDAQHYRCKFATDRAPIPGLDHPKNVYVRESAIVPKFDECIGHLFDPVNLDQTCEALAAAGGASDADHDRIAAAKRKIDECDRRLKAYRANLDAGGDPVVVAGWMSEVQGERLRAEREIGRAQASGTFTKKQIRRCARRGHSSAGRGGSEAQGSGVRGARNQRHLRPDQACRTDRITAGYPVGNCKCRRGDFNLEHTSLGDQLGGRRLAPQLLSEPTARTASTSRLRCSVVTPRSTLLGMISPSWKRWEPGGAVWTAHKWTPGILEDDAIGRTGGNLRVVVT